LWIESYAPGVSFYLERTVPLASNDGNEFRSNYILRNAEVLLDETGPLRPLASAEREVADCSGPQIFLLSSRSADLGDAIEEYGVPRLTESRRWMAFGPDCGVVDELADEMVDDEEAED
jgi:hypothetical protein